MRPLAYLTTRNVFEHAWPMLEPAVERRGAHTKDTVWHSIRSGQARLWATDKSAMVCNVQHWPSGKIIGNTWLLGGDLDEIVAVMDPAARIWATNSGCVQQYMDARPGWVRVLPGYREIARTLVRDLT